MKNGRYPAWMTAYLPTRRQGDTLSWVVVGVMGAAGAFCTVALVFAAWDLVQRYGGL